MHFKISREWDGTQFMHRQLTDEDEVSSNPSKSKATNEKLWMLRTLNSFWRHFKNQEILFFEKIYHSSTHTADLIARWPWTAALTRRCDFAVSAELAMHFQFSLIHVSALMCAVDWQKNELACGVMRWRRCSLLCDAWKSLSWFLERPLMKTHNSFSMQHDLMLIICELLLFDWVMKKN